MTDKLMLVGLCGRSGSGKGYVSKIFYDFNIPSIDTDVLYCEMTGPCEKMSECMTEIVEHFGRSVVSDDNSLNRPVMRKIVFSEDKSKLELLNKITHKFILKKALSTAEELYNRGYKIVLVDAPLLFESGFDKMCKKTICVTAPENILIERIKKRDSLSEEDAKKRLSTQKPLSELEERADYVIANDTDKNILIQRVKECADDLKRIYHNEYEK